MENADGHELGEPDSSYKALSPPSVKLSLHQRPLLYGFFTGEYLWIDINPPAILWNKGG